MKSLTLKMHEKTWSENLGIVSGYALGVVTGIISFIRQARMFHPRGLLFRCEVESSILPDHGFIRFSSAWWKKHELRDVLGISIRFMDSPPTGTQVTKSDQDLLFATIKYPWQTPIGPLLTHYQDFFDNIYYAVSPFVNQNREKVKYRLITSKSSDYSDKRDEKLRISVKGSHTRFTLQELKLSNKKKEWKPVASISVKEELNYDQEAIRFNPFNTGSNIVPIGFIHHLRIGSYFLSQLMRPRKSALQV